MKEVKFTLPLTNYLASKGGYTKQAKPNRVRVAGTKKYDLNNKEDVEEFNEIYQTLLNSNLGPMVMTGSGGISICRENRRGVWHLDSYNTGCTILARLEGYTFCYTIGNKKEKEEGGIRGMKAFLEFKDLCLDKGIDLEEYAIENGAEVKNTIEAPKISMKYIMTSDDEGLDNCHHIDFHNSYPAGLCNKHPEFRPIVEPLYEARKEKPINKAILNLTIGYMQSLQPRVKARWAHLSKDAIEDNNRRIDDLATRLESSGREILGYNTDGIWYRGEIYHGDGEGNHLGEWSNDHVNCVFRSKSDGAYEFMEDGKYHPVVRGKTNYDWIEPRDMWKWGDIYRHDMNIIKYSFDKNIGVVPKEVKA